MSVVVPFPVTRVSRSRQASARHGHGSPVASAQHPARGGTIIGWVRPAACVCCGRPTLRAGLRPGGAVLCSHCTPPSVA